MQTDERLTPLPDHFSKLAPYLGLGERRTTPEPLLLKEPDPLGASAVLSVTLESVSSGQPGEQNSFEIEHTCVGRIKDLRSHCKNIFKPLFNTTLKQQNCICNIHKSIVFQF
jgi:hypothetical protein